MTISFNQLDSLQDDIIGLVHNLEILGHVPQITGHECLQLNLQGGNGVFQLFVVLSLNLLLLSLLDDTVDDALRYLEAVVELVKLLVLRLQSLAVDIDIAEVGIYDDALGGKLSVQFGVAGSIEGNKEVWHNSASAIYGTMAAQGVVLQRV